MKNFGRFLLNLFTKDVPIKLLAILIGALTVLFINL